MPYPPIFAILTTKTDVCITPNSFYLKFNLVFFFLRLKFVNLGGNFSVGDFKKNKIWPNLFTISCSDVKVSRVLFSFSMSLRMTSTVFTLERFPVVDLNR